MVPNVLLGLLLLMHSTLLCQNAPVAKPNPAADFVHSANVKSKNGDIAGALADIDLALQIDPNNTLAYSTRGNIHGLMQQDWQAAIQDFSKAFALDSTRVDFLNIRGMMHLKSKDYQAAFIDFNHAIQRDKTNAYYYQNRGIALLLLAKPNLACPDFRKSLALGNAGAEKWIAEHCQTK